MINITITNAGSSISTLLDIYAGTSISDLTLYIANVNKSDLLSGYTFTESPGATFYRLKDKNCNAFVDLPCTVTTTTTNSPGTTTTHSPVTTTTHSPVTTTTHSPITTTTTTCSSIYNYQYENYAYSSKYLACLDGYPSTSLYSYNTLAIGIVLYTSNINCALSGSMPGSGYGVYYPVFYNSNLYAMEIDVTGHILSYTICSSVTTTSTTPVGSTTTTSAVITTTTTAMYYYTAQLYNCPCGSSATVYFNSTIFYNTLKYYKWSGGRSIYIQSRNTSGTSGINGITDPTEYSYCDGPCGITTTTTTAFVTTTTSGGGTTTTTTNAAVVYTRLLRCDTLQDRQTTDIPYGSPYSIWTNGSYYYKVISQQYTAYGYTLISSLYSTALSDCPGFTTTTTTIASCLALVITNVAFAYQSGSDYYYSIYFNGGETNCGSVTIYYWNGSSWTANTDNCTSPRLISTNIPNGSCLQIKANKNCTVGDISPDSNTYQLNCTTTTTTTIISYYRVYEYSCPGCSFDSIMKSIYSYVPYSVGTYYYNSSNNKTYRTELSGGDGSYGDFSSMSGPFNSCALACGNTTTTTVAPTTTTTITAVYDFTSPGHDFSDPTSACADTGAYSLHLYSHILPGASGTVYSDSGCTLPYNGNSRYFKVFYNAVYYSVKISSVGGTSLWSPCP